MVQFAWTRVSICQERGKLLNLMGDRKTPSFRLNLLGSGIVHCLWKVSVYFLLPITDQFQHWYSSVLDVFLVIAKDTNEPPGRSIFWNEYKCVLAVCGNDNPAAWNNLLLCGYFTNTVCNKKYINEFRELDMSSTVIISFNTHSLPFLKDSWKIADAI